MPSDANGVYSLPPAYHVTLGDTILPGQHNPVFEDIASALSARVSVNGASPMTGPLKGFGGSAAAPGISFNGFAGFGFFKSTNGVGVSVNGVQVAEFTSSGILKSSRYIGELIAWSGSAAPSLCVLPVGQTLSRATYADLWTFAQTEIAAGSNFFNNGNGTTTFGIGDLRGRVLAGKDDMGGVAAGRLTLISAVVGSFGGAETNTLGLTHLPTGLTSTVSVTTATNNVGTIPLSSAAIASLQTQGAATTNITPNNNNGTWTGTTSLAGTGSGTATSNNTGGTAHQNLQPTLITNFALFAGA